MHILKNDRLLYFLKKGGFLFPFLPIIAIVIYLLVTPDIPFWTYFFIIFFLSLIMFFLLYKLFTFIDDRLQRHGIELKNLDNEVEQTDKQPIGGEHNVDESPHQVIEQVEGVSPFKKLHPFCDQFFDHAYTEMKKLVGQQTLEQFQKKLLLNSRRHFFVFMLTIGIISASLTSNGLTMTTFCLAILIVYGFSRIVYPNRKYVTLVIAKTINLWSNAFKLPDISTLRRFKRQYYHYGFELNDARKINMELVFSVKKDELYFIHYHRRKGLAEKAGLLYKLQPPEGIVPNARQVIMTTEQHKPESPFEFVEKRDGRFIYAVYPELSQTIINELTNISKPLLDRQMAHTIYFGPTEIVIYLPNFIAEKEPIRRNDLSYVVNSIDFIVNFYNYTLSWRQVGDLSH